jgi:hypothetical protein
VKSTRKSFASPRGFVFIPEMHEQSGTVKVIFEEQTFASGFNKREFVITDEADKYPQDIKFECVKDKVELVNKLSVGQKVKVTFDLRGNEYNGKYYVNLAAWKVESLAAGNSADSSEPPPFDPADEILDEEPPF